MHKNEPRANLTLITHAIKVYELKVRTIKTHKAVLAPLKSNFEVDLTSHYKKSTTLQYLMSITIRHWMLEFRDLLFIVFSLPMN